MKTLSIEDGIYDELRKAAETRGLDPLDLIQGILAAASLDEALLDRVAQRLEEYFGSV